LEVGLLEVVGQLELSNDAMKNQVYSSHPFYAIINFRGAIPMYIPVVWGIRVPPKIMRTCLAFTHLQMKLHLI
jgi:hypothetical protein